MEEGAFALIDCLGFKGIWKRANPALLLQKLSQIEQTAVEQIAGKENLKHFSFSPMTPRIRLLSDTVAISLQYEKKEGETPDEYQKNYLIVIACHIVIQILDSFITGEPYLVLRGCITYGEHISEGNFIVGPAVDEAAEHMNVAEGAFIWLLPSAAIRYRSTRERWNALLALDRPDILALAVEWRHKRGRDMTWALEIIEKHGREAFGEVFRRVTRSAIAAPIVIDPYDMPLKSGARLRCPVINPLAFHKSAEERQALIGRYSSVISGSQVGIWLKHQHTLEMLEAADRECARFAEAINELEKPATSQPEPPPAQAAEPIMTEGDSSTSPPSPASPSPEHNPESDKIGSDNAPHIN